MVRFPPSEEASLSGHHVIAVCSSRVGKTVHKLLWRACHQERRNRSPERQSVCLRNTPGVQNIYPFTGVKGTGVHLSQHFTGENGSGVHISQYFAGVNGTRVHFSLHFAGVNGIRVQHFAGENGTGVHFPSILLERMELGSTFPAFC